MKIKFKSAMHRKNFTGFISPKNSDYYCSRSDLTGRRTVSPKRRHTDAPPTERNRIVAAAFLLSADKLLWERSEKALARYSVNFGMIDLSGISTEGLALYKAARAVYNGDSDISLSELCDWTLIDDPTTMTIFTGVMLLRNGVKILKRRT